MMASYLFEKTYAIGIFKWNRVFSISKWVSKKKYFSEPDLHIGIPTL